jgi:hypothetical protein
MNNAVWVSPRPISNAVASPHRLSALSGGPRLGSAWVHSPLTAEAQIKSSSAPVCIDCAGVCASLRVPLNARDKSCGDYLFLVCSVLTPANATEVVVYVSKSRQAMSVYVDEGLEFIWPVSTARGGYQTPSGEYYPTALDRYHRSSRYHNTLMPYAIFFRSGYAIHGSYDIDNLAGC